MTVRDFNYQLTYSMTFREGQKIINICVGVLHDLRDSRPVCFCEHTCWEWHSESTLLDISD